MEFGALYLEVAYCWIDFGFEGSRSRWYGSKISRCLFVVILSLHFIDTRQMMPQYAADHENTALYRYSPDDATICR